MELHEIKKLKERKVSQLMTDAGMFFAFSNEQFVANKTPLAEGEKYVSLGAGAYLPKSKVSVWVDGMDQIELWFKNKIKAGKLRDKHISYELHNHEAFYTNDIDDTMDALGDDYTREEVLAVFRNENL